MTFLPRDARNAKCGIAIVSRPSVTLMHSGHIGWTSLKLITRIISIGSSSSLLRGTTSAIYRVAQNKILHQTICNIFATIGQILKILEAV